MIQFNLLPDVKLEFVKAERTKHAVISGAVIATGVALVIFVLLFVAVHLVQKKIIEAQTNDIVKYSEELKNTPDLDKILTIQNQLKALPGLHAVKPDTSRTFSLIQQMTPKAISLTDVTVDFTANVISISGVSSTLGDVNTFVDTVKYTNFTPEGSTAAEKAFSNVVMSEFSRNTKTSTFMITANYEPRIYDNALSILFTVPNGVSTPSVLGQPTQLFTNKSNESNEQ